MKSISWQEWRFPSGQYGDFLTSDRCGKLRRNTHHLFFPPLARKHQSAPNSMYISIHSCLRIPTQYNRGPSGPLNAHNYYPFFSSLYISANARIYPISRPCIPSSSSRNCINVPYLESLGTNIYSEGSLPLPIPSEPPSSSYRVTSSTPHMIRIFSPTDYSISTVLPHLYSNALYFLAFNPRLSLSP